MQEDPKKKREELYDALVGEGLYTNSYGDFESDYSNPENIKFLYNGLKEMGGITDANEDEWSKHYFGDLLKKKISSSFPPVIQEPSEDAPLPHPSKPSGVESSPEVAPAAEQSTEPSTEERIRAIHQEFHEAKHGKSEKQGFAIAPELKEAFMKEAGEKSDSLFQIHEQKFKIQAQELAKKYQAIPLQEGEDPASIESQFQDELGNLQAQQNKLLQDQEELEYAKLAQKYEQLSTKKPSKKDAGALESFTKQGYNIFANVLPSGLAASDSEALPTLDVVPRDNGSLRFSYTNPNNFGAIGSDTRLQNVLTDLERRIDEGESLNNLAESVDHPDARQALVETIGEIKGKATKDVVKSTFAFMLNRQMGRRKAENLKEIEQQEQESAELLENVPLTWQEAKENDNLSGYISGALGQGLGSSVAAASLGMVPGARVLEYGEVYNAGLKAKAQRLSEKYGMQVTPEMLVTSNDDADVIETASLMGNINSGLETVGTIFGLGKLAKGIFAKKVSEEIMKRSMGRHVFDAMVGVASSTAVGAGTEMAQSANTIAGTKKLAGAGYGDVYSNLFIAATNKVLGRKVKEGQSLDDAAASVTEADIEEIIEAGRQGAIAEGGMGGVGNLSSLAKTGRQMYIDKKRGVAITRDEAEAKLTAGSKDIEVINDPALSAKFQVGITSATDKDPEVKSLMDEARAANDKGDFEAADAAYNKVLDVGEKKLTEHLSKIEGVKATLNRTRGNFFGYTEPTFVADVEAPVTKVKQVISELAATGMELKQDNIHISQVRNLVYKKNETFGEPDADGWVNEHNVDVYFDKEITEAEFQELVEEVEGKNNLPGFTMHPDKKGINLYSISKAAPHEEFIAKVVKLKESLDNRGSAPRFKESIRRLLNIGREDYGATRSYEQVRGEVLPTPEVSAGERKRIENILGKAKKALSKIVPNLDVVYYNGAEEGAAALKRVDPSGTFDPESNGFFTGNTIGIDLSRADASTAFHEALHPIIDAVRATKPELFESLANEASNAKIPMEDGNYAKYLEYANGNKEEALVEYLAHFAEDGSTNKNIIASIKDLINKFLDAIGLSSQDFNLDLDNVKDLRQFAGQMSKALNRGKTINVTGKAKNSTAKFQKRSPLGKRIKPGRKLNRTALKIAVDRNTEFQTQRTHILNDPDAYAYNPQNLKDVEAFLATKTDLELDGMINGNNNMATLAGITLMRRLNQKGLDTDQVFKKLRKLGTTTGQLLRQFGELKKYSSEEITYLVEKNLESMRLALTADQRNTLQGLAKDYATANSDLHARRTALSNSPVVSNTMLDAVDRAEERVAQSYINLNKFVGEVSPLGVDSMIAVILQGNLLTTKSVTTNIVGNLAQALTRQQELLTGDIAAYIANQGWQNEKGLMKIFAPLETYLGAAARSTWGFGSGTWTALKDVIAGRGNETAATLELRRQLRPLVALKQFLMATAGKNETLPVSEKTGRVPMRLYIEKGLEATAGIPAEMMFRMLYLGDKPFREAARQAGMYRLYRESGGKSNSASEYRKFIANMTPQQKERVEHFMNEATLSDTRFVARRADEFIKWAGRSIKDLSEYFPEGTMRDSVSILGNVLLKANIPFVRVPSNIIQYLIELAVPVVPLIGSMVYFKQGNERKAGQLMARAITGLVAWTWANALYDAGVIVASSQGDEEKERDMKHEMGSGNGVNISALARFNAGIQDPENANQPGDKIWKFDRFGVPGLYLAFVAEWNEEMFKKHGKRRNEIHWTDQTIATLGASTKTFMQAPFLHGSYVAQQAMAQGEMGEFFAELGNTLTAVVIPNQVRTVTMSRAPYLLRAKDKEVWQTFKEKQSVKLNADLKNNIEGIYPTVGMWGEIPQPNKDLKPGSTDAFIYQFFDITQNKEIRDPRSIEVYNLWMRTGELAVSKPTATISAEGDKILLTEQDHVYTQMLAGQMKAQLIGLEINQPEWKDLDDKTRLAIIGEINEWANKAAKEYMLDRILDGVDAERIVLNEETGTYSYTSPSEFDFELAKKAMGEF